MKVRGIRNLLELPLVTAQQLHLGDVTDVLLDPTEQRILKLVVNWVVDPPAASGSDSDLPFSQIMQFDPHQVVVHDEIGETAGLDLLNYAADELVSVNARMLDHPVVTPGGQALGELVDLYLDEEDGAVVGYEVSSGQPEQNRILAPTTDMEFQGTSVVVPEGLRTIRLPEPEEELEAAEAMAVDEAALDVGARTQQPELKEELQDPNAYPGAHPHWESPDIHQDRMS